MCSVSDNRSIRTVHKVRHAIFGQFYPPSLCHTLSQISGPLVRHTSRTPPFLVGLVQITRTKAPYTNSVSIVRGGFSPGVLVRGFCQGVFCLEGFVRGGFCPFPLLPEYICYNRKFNITLNFMFCGIDSPLAVPPFQNISRLLSAAYRPTTCIYTVHISMLPSKDDQHFISRVLLRYCSHLI